MNPQPLEIRLLGQFEIRLDGQALDLQSRPAQSLLAYLALSAGVAHRRERLAGLLWPDSTDLNARGYLRQALWRIRKALAGFGREAIAADDLTVAFQPGPDCRIDTLELQRDVTEGTVEDLIACVAVYHGPLLPGFYSDWAEAERERLQVVFESRMGALLDRLVADSRWGDTVDWAGRWIGLGQTPEPAYRALMRAHHALGDRASMAAAFQRCAEALQRDLGVEPSEATHALYRQLLQDAPSPSRTPTLPEYERRSPTTPSTANTVPNQLTRFVGRERETNEVRHLIVQARLVTLTGVGGCGKTRLALQAVQSMQAEFPGGLAYVELAPLTDGALVVPTVAAALGVVEQLDRPLLATLTECLHSKRSLLILDNGEHLIEPVARLADALLRGCPQLHVLTTTREALGIAGETIFQVPSLSVPGPADAPETLLQTDSVQLFADRASAAVPSFAITPETAPLVVSICQRLDGIPLAIELAAARLRMLPLDQIAARLNDRFRLLTGGSRTMLPRQQTLRATMDWSYNLLTEAERLLFCRMSVFVGSWTLEAAEWVGADEVGTESEAGSQTRDGPHPEAVILSESVLDLLTQLVNKSLVVADHMSEGRYRMLETIRQYALERLVDFCESESARTRHLSYYLALVEQAEPHLTGPQQLEWYRRLDAELVNLRAALEWAAESDVPAGLRVVSALSYYADARGLAREGHEWLAQLLGRDTAMTEPRVHARALAIHSFILTGLYNLAAAREAAEASLAMFRSMEDEAGIAMSLAALGQVHMMHGNIVAARPLLDESLALYRELGDKLGQANVLQWLSLDHRFKPDAWWNLLEESLALSRAQGHLAGIASRLVGLAQQAYWQGDLVKPKPWLDEALELARALRNKSGEAWVMEMYGNLDFRSGRYAEALASYENSLVLNEAVGQQAWALWARVNMACIAARQGDVAGAQQSLADCLRQFVEAPIVIGVVYTIEAFASLKVQQGQWQRAAVLLSWAEAYRLTIGDLRPAVEQGGIDRDWAAVSDGLPPQELADARAHGAAMTLAEAVEYALSPAE